MIESFSNAIGSNSQFDYIVRAPAAGTYYLRISAATPSSGKTIDVYRPGQPPVCLAADGVLEGEPVLPGFRLPVAEVFGWLIYRKPDPGPPAGPGADPA